WAVGAALVLGIIGAGAWRGLQDPPLWTAGSRGPLKLATGSPVATMEARAKPHTVRFADASQVRIAPGSRIVPLVSTDTSFELLLDRGSAEFTVTPGGPRRWVVDAGSARIEVVG